MLSPVFGTNRKELGYNGPETLTHLGGFFQRYFKYTLTLKSGNCILVYFNDVCLGFFILINGVLTDPKS